MSPYGTRPSNANAHPGQILLAADGARKRRSSEEMTQARLQKEEQARTLQQKEAALLQRIAELEAQSRALESQSVGPSALPAKVKSECEIYTALDWNVDWLGKTSTQRRVQRRLSRLPPKIPLKHLWLPGREVLS